MKRSCIYAAVAMLGIASPLSAQICTLCSQDFEGEFVGPGKPASIVFTFGGVSGGVDPFNPTFPQEITATDGAGGTQGYKIGPWDTSAVGPDGNGFSYFFGGFQIFAGFFGDGSRTMEAVGANDPANWQLSIDVRSQGAVDMDALQGKFTRFDSDYDATFGVDGDGNGQVNGADTYILPFDLTDDTTDNNYTTNTFTLDMGSGPATTEVAGDIVRFEDTETWILDFSFGSGEYGLDAGNSIEIDNIVFEFIPPVTGSLPGDYNDDGVVNTSDFVTFADNLGQAITLPNEGAGITPGMVTEEDYTFWASQFGATSLVSQSVTATPEPSSLILAVLGCLALRFRGTRS